MTPAVSVIMPCYNASKFLSESINSILEQSFCDIELIAVDDGSTDDTLSILNKYAKYDKRIKVYSQKNAGVSSARNVGIFSAKGKYLAFLDADDWWDKEFIETMLPVIDNENICLAYCGWQNIGIKGPRGEPFIPPDYEQQPDKLEKLFESCRWPIHAVLVRHDMLKNMGGFDPKLKTSEDFAVWLRLALINKISRVPKVMAFYRHHGDERATSNTEGMVFDKLFVQEQFLHQNASIASRIGKAKILELTYGQLLKRGYEAYWARDLKLAQTIFRYVIRKRFFELKDLKYLLPALLPFFLYQNLLRINDG